MSKRHRSLSHRDSYSLLNLRNGAKRYLCHGNHGSARILNFHGESYASEDAPEASIETKEKEARSKIMRAKMLRWDEKYSQFFLFTMGKTREDARGFIT